MIDFDKIKRPDRTFPCGGLHPAFYYLLKISIFLWDLFCDSNRNNRPVYHHGVQRVPGYPCRKWRISPGTFAAVLTHLCFHSCCHQTYSAFWLHGRLRTVWAHWCSRGTRIVLALQRWTWRQCRNRNRWFVCQYNSSGWPPFYYSVRTWSSNSWRKNCDIRPMENLTKPRQSIHPFKKYYNRGRPIMIKFRRYFFMNCIYGCVDSRVEMN